MSVMFEELRKARSIVAELAEGNPLLAPVFERLDKEYTAMLGRQETPIMRIARQRREIRELA